jgi:hypothetical protein
VRQENGREYGLIAEEVAEVAPELVAYGEDGQPYSVRYYVLPALLVNELQRQQRTIEAQQGSIAALRARMEELESQLGGSVEWVAR